MKTVNIPEQILPLLINSACSANGQVSLATIRKIVEQSGIDSVSPDLATLNTLLIVNGSMPDITESLKGTRLIEEEEYTFEKYYAIPQLVEASSVEDNSKYCFTLDEWTKGEKICK